MNSFSVEAQTSQVSNSSFKKNQDYFLSHILVEVASRVKLLLEIKEMIIWVMPMNHCNQHQWNIFDL
jgi:hypothetical protein